MSTHRNSQGSVSDEKDLEKVQGMKSYSSVKMLETDLLSQSLCTLSQKSQTLTIQILIKMPLSSVGLNHKLIVNVFRELIATISQRTILHTLKSGPP